MPLPGLRYAQVIKTRRRRRLVRVTRRVVFGTLEAVEHVLAACGWHLNTAFIERLNLSIRQHVAAIGRRVSTLCQGEDDVHQQLVCIMCTIISAYRTPACANRCRSPCRRTEPGRSSARSPTHPPSPPRPPTH